jgi:acyl-coenzyme A thioesterase PaaI-like protein
VPNVDPSAAGWKTAPDMGFIDLVGPIWTRQEDDRHAFGFVAERKHANLLDVVQGGMLMTFADRALGLAAWRAAGDRPCVTVQFDMRFMSSGQIGEFIELRPELVRRTASLVFMRGTLTAGERVLAAADGIWKILRER